jgi:Tol biopolymer transport system component
MMSDLEGRFRALARVGSPDLWTEIEQRQPGWTPPELSSGRRWLAASVAFVVAAAGLTFAAVVFRGGDQPRPAFAVANGEIAFSGFDGNSWQIYSVEPDGSGLAQLTQVSDLETATSPAWSPDGTRLAFVVQQSHADGTTGRSDLWVMNADGSDPRPLIDGPGSSWSPAWSPDGSRIAFARGDPASLYVVDSNGSDLTRLTPDDVNASDLSWSPDGSRIVFNPEGEVEKDLYVVNADGTGERALLQAPGYQMEPDWSPDGQKIAFTTSSPDGAGFGISVMDADGTNVRSLTDHPAAQSAEWSPDGRQIAFMALRPGTDHDTLYVMNADGTEVFELPGLPTEATSPSWQPVPLVATPSVTLTPVPGITPVANGQIYFRVGGGDGPSRIEAVEADGTGQHVVFEGDPLLHVTQIAWSPDGSRIAYLDAIPAERGIYVANPNGSDPVRLTHGANDAWPSWSPDGSKIVFSGSADEPSLRTCEPGADFRCPTDIYVIDADGTDLTRLTDDPAPEYQPTWSPSGDRIAFVRSSGGTAGEAPLIFTMAVDGSDIRKVSSGEGGSDSSPSWSPDGSRIAFVGFRFENTGIWVVDAIGSNEHQLVGQDWYSVQDPVWSPAGDLIAFTGMPSGGDAALYNELYLMDPDGGNVRQLAEAPGWGVAGDVAWQPVPTGQVSPSPSGPPSPAPSAELGQSIEVGQASALLYADGSVWVDVLRDARTSTGTVLRIDEGSGEILASIPVDAFPGSESGGGGMAYDGRFIWIVGTSSPIGAPERGILVRIDPETNEVARFDLNVATAGTDLVFDGQSLWTTGTSSPGNPLVLQIDPATGRVVDEIPFEAQWWGSLVVVDGAIWVTEMSVKNYTVQGDLTLVRLDPATGAEMTRVPFGTVYGTPASTSPVAAGGAIWAGAGDRLLRIDPQTGDVTAQIPASIGLDLEYADDGSFWFLRSWDALQRLDPTTGKIDVTVQLDRKPIPVAIAVAPHSVWVLSYGGTLTRVALT